MGKTDISGLEKWHLTITNIKLNVNMQNDRGNAIENSSDKKEKLKGCLMALAIFSGSGFAIAMTIIQAGGIATYLEETFVGILLLIGCHILLYFIVNRK